MRGKLIDFLEINLSIKKFKTFEDAERALWVFNPDEIYYKKILKLFDNRLYLKVNKTPCGIFKYKTFEDAEKDKIKWLSNKNH